MSKGSRGILVRFPPDELQALKAAVASETRGEPWTWSSFIRHCVREQLKKRERSRTWRKGKQDTQGEGNGDAVDRL